MIEITPREITPFRNLHSEPVLCLDDRGRREALRRIKSAGRASPNPWRCDEYSELEAYLARKSS